MRRNQADQLPLFAEESQAVSDTPPALQEPGEEAPVDVNEPDEVAREGQEPPDKAIDERQHKRHIVQPYRMIKIKRKRRLTPIEPLSVASEEAALERAKSLFETGRYAGVDAFTVTADPDMDEYVEPVFHARLGQVPRAEYEEWA